MEGPMNEDRRQHPRVDTNIEIIFREAGSLIRSYMVNVSNGGLFIKTEHPLPLDAQIGMRVTLPDDDEAMEIRGKVVWTNAKSKSFPQGMGVQFTEIAPAHKEKIRVFVEGHLKDIQSRSLL